ncbi:hypothetical protein AMTRI_Chr01g110220 [Amborella trichopoda]|uniref:FAS1 domain-containing protein n=1 Tax=Amborella trichopoda TaxID=13333 RepID=W1NRJ3_AMBTC|nr:hypothetical protein AMTR_s00130p00053270 [Amborella trichopoda]
MTTKFSFFLLLSLLLHAQLVAPIDHNIQLVLSRRGYSAVALTLSLMSHPLLPESGNWTMFCAPDHAFSLSKYGQPPLMLLEYQVARHRLTIEDLSALPAGTKFQTRYFAHYLVLTEWEGVYNFSLNGVEITEPNLYDDGHIILHGVMGFMEPTFPGAAECMTCEGETPIGI